MTVQPGPSGRLALAVTVLAGLAFVIAAALLVPWHWLPGGHVRAVAPGDFFTAAQIARGDHVSGLLRHAAWGNVLVSVLVAGLLGFTRLGSSLVRRLPGRWWLQVVLGCLALSALAALTSLPLAWSAQRVELSEGLSHQAWGSWLSDRAIGLGVTWAFTTVAILVVVALARMLPRSWPLWGAVAAAALTMIGSFVYPVLVEPLFNSFTPMKAGPLRSDVFALAAKEHVHIDDVLVADASRRTTTLNAYVSGFGSTRRVVVYDTLLTGLPQKETEMIVAHELGHAKHDDVLVGTVLGALGSAFGVGLLGLVLTRRRLLERAEVDGLGDPGVVPLLLALAVVGSLLASPVQNTISRAIEARADRSALQATRDPDTFIAMQKQLALRSLSDPTPPAWSQFWFGSHPTTLQRIGMAEAVR
ncbi:M48 family metallopeptidase [Nocardioides pocheonensis]|uniref:M48 family peptidase n=1 Tax=Nocardioides pocheonensis TaxID=661485 RepID=A0A3N0GPN5_9ACTN|nr:M48 family metallopeptidase [Nocardioides pocheonensis]RNM14118.1 M48 family peptidase [Nocardioides pocheonensis]